MLHSYDPWLLLLSYLVATFAAFTTLDLASRMSRADGGHQRVWVIAGALAMGLGIWSMHFIGMIALHLPVRLSYDATTTLLSIMPAVGASALALQILRRPVVDLRTKAGGAIAMGIAISAMHYTGMAAIKMSPDYSYDAGLVTLSVLIGISASFAALSIALRSRHLSTASSFAPRAAAALVMGVAIVAMHYTGMAATYFAADSVCISSPLGVDPVWLAVMVGVGSCGILFTTLLVSMRDVQALEHLRQIDATTLERAASLAEMMAADARASESHTRAIIESSLDCIITMDRQGLIVEFNPAAESTFGYARADVLGRSLSESLVPPDLRQAHERGLARLLAGGHSDLIGRRIEIMGMRADGSEFPVELAITTTPIRGQPAFTAHLRDLTERMATEQQLKHLANIDSLTGLSNRLHFRQRLDARLQRLTHEGAAQDKRLSLLFVDLDHFKVVNDSLGHDVGDEMLAVLAQRLKSCVREGDLVARLGGDEFVMLIEQGLPAAHSEEAVLARIKAIVGEPLHLCGRTLHATCSVGVSHYPDDGEDADTLLRKADAAMYVAKRGGRNDARVFTGEIEDAISQRLEIEAALRRALEHDEFVLHYQPLVGLDDEGRAGGIVGAEALLRWQDPQRGLVPPSDFIGMAEETGLIQPLGEWVLRRACQQGLHWRCSNGEPLPLSINISARQLQDEQFIDKVRHILAETGFPPTRLEFELTESLFTEEGSLAVEMLRGLANLGARLAIDDFGTGYSNLRYLKRFPVARLKIDRSFVAQVGIDPGDTAIATAIIALARGMGVGLVGEGVETDAQRRWLGEAGCGTGQGFLLGRPVVAAAFEEQLMQEQLAPASV